MHYHPEGQSKSQSPCGRGSSRVWISGGMSRFLQQSAEGLVVLRSMTLASIQVQALVLMLKVCVIMDKLLKLSELHSDV